MARLLVLSILACAASFPSSIYAQWHGLKLIDTTTSGLIYQQHASCDVASDGTLGIVWQENTTDRRNPIVFLKSVDHGATFQKSVVVDTILRDHSEFEPGEERDVHDIKFDADGNVWVLWSFYLVYDLYDEAYLRLSRSMDGGRSFVEVFNTLRASTTFNPRLAVARDGSVFVLWDDLQFKCTRFVRGNIGNRVDADIPSGIYGISSSASIVVDASLNVYCVWNGFTYDSTYHYFVLNSTSRDSGKTFPYSARVDSTNDQQFDPNLTVSDSSQLFIAYRVDYWINSGTLSGRLAVVVSKTGGSSFLPPSHLADSAGYLAVASVAFASKVGFLAAWNVGGHSYFSRSTDLGGSFTKPLSIDTVRLSGGAIICADTSGNAFVIAYSGIRNNSASAFFISVADLETGIGDDRNRMLPRTFELLPNYPNPFNPSTKIRYDLPRSSHVTLRVYNLLGQQIATLVDEHEPPGTYTAHFNGTNLPSGVYFYRLTAGEFTQTKKLVLMK